MHGLGGELPVLEIHRRTAFTFDERGRMVHESAPDRSRGKRFSFTGCPDGNLGVVRDDVADAVAVELMRLLADEPPLSDPASAPLYSYEYSGLLGGAGMLGLLWSFPHPLHREDGVHLVWSGSDEAEDLLRRFEQVMPPGLAEMGFGAPSGPWAPWCVALVGGRVASVAQTVRSGPDGAEVGVGTDPSFRGRGLAAAVSAGWSRHAQLSDRTLFYSTARQNTSSTRVTERLGLRFLGSTFAVA